MAKILEIKDLSVSFGEARVVKSANISLKKGEITALVGESGSGKSITALSILRLLPKSAHIDKKSSILFDKKDLLHLRKRQMRSIRGTRISMIFQEPMTSLNPLHTIGKQLKEVILLHNRISKTNLSMRVEELLGVVGLEALKARLHAFPHELSGGQRQRLMIAMALANEPDVLIADEPTTALDVTVQKQILDLLVGLKKKLGLSILLITHDLSIVEKMADKVFVMNEGRVVESGAPNKIFTSPKNTYTKTLLSSAPKGGPAPIEKYAKTLLETKSLSVHFSVKQGFFRASKEKIKAVDDVSISLNKGETLGIVGESGSGKSTLSYAILRLIKSQGDIKFLGENISELNQKKLRPLRKKMQIVFQDPFASLNPRMSIEQIINEGLNAHNVSETALGRINIVDDALNDVGLSPEIKNRYPHEFSGGQRQRIGIARAIALNPEFIALDEPTSALDLKTQGEILDILKNLQKARGVSYLFISHDLRVIKSIAHKIIVMKDGKIVESGTAKDILSSPKEEYTKTLLEASLA